MTRIDDISVQDCETSPPYCTKEYCIVPRLANRAMKLQKQLV
jgi:hypothetical protein